MQHDQATPLAAAAARKHDAALARASSALRALDTAGQQIHFQAGARAARVSRQWLYQQPELRSEIERLRDHQPPQRPSRVPAAQRASEASLRQRNRSLLDENQRLRAENAALKNELALAYGERRRAPRLA
jgi:hypothetical protein